MSKKIMAILMVMMMVLGMSTMAMAADEDPTITKTYESLGDGSSPAETFTFDEWKLFAEDSPLSVEEVEALGMPSIGEITFIEGAAGNTTDGVKSAGINLPTYTRVGIYTYTFNEAAGDTAGVTYHSTQMTLKVTVTQGADGLVTTSAIYADGVGEGITKTDNITNTYASGKLTVKKTVSGNAGDLKKPFTFTVVLTVPDKKVNRSKIGAVLKSQIEGNTLSDPSTDGNTITYTFALANGDTVAFTNIPAGVTYSVTEIAEDYTSSFAEGATSGEITGNADVNTTINNKKDTTPDTGISLDNIPYIILLSVAFLGLLFFVTKRRAINE
ncbi:MAG: hypothetical protein GX096_05400 [Clostridiales bacterium]|nr:hypothetical protein [Clostridiales bacterium]